MRAGVPIAVLLSSGQRHALARLADAQHFLPGLDDLVAVVLAECVDRLLRLSLTALCRSTPPRTRDRDNLHAPEASGLDSVAL